MRILSDISFALRRGETLGIIGESGCGKSMTALALLRMVPSPPGRITGGRVLLNGEDLVQVSEKRIRGIRGGEMSMIFQEPMTSLNPVYTIGNQIAETIRRHRPVDRSAAWKEAVGLLDMVHIPAPERRVREYPHQLSGGMRQRVMIAMALACEPTVLLADEPTTALDVTVQAQIFDLLKEIQASHGTCIVLITHDFGAVSETGRSSPGDVRGSQGRRGHPRRDQRRPAPPVHPGAAAVHAGDRRRPGRRTRAAAGNPGVGAGSAARDRGLSVRAPLPVGDVPMPRAAPVLASRGITGP